MCALAGVRKMHTSNTETYECPHMEHNGKKKNMLGRAHHFPVLLFHLHCLFFSLLPLSSISSLFHLIAPSLCERSTLFFAKHSHAHTQRESRAPFGVCRKGYVLFFFPLLHISKEGSNHCCFGADACGVISLQKPVEAAFSRLTPRGLRGILECRGMY